MRNKVREIGSVLGINMRYMQKYVQNLALYDTRPQAYTETRDHLYHYRGVSWAEVEDFVQREVLGQDFNKAHTYSVESHVKEANCGSNMLSFTPSPYSAGNFANKLFTNPFTTMVPGVTQTGVFRTAYSLIMVDIKSSNALLPADTGEILFADTDIGGNMPDVDLQAYEDGDENAHCTVKSYANTEAEWAQVSYVNGVDFRMTSEDVESIAHLVGLYGLPQFYNSNHNQINAEFAPMGFSIIILSPCPHEEAKMLEQAKIDAASDSPDTELGKAMKWQNQRPITAAESVAAALAVKGIFKRLPYEIYKGCGTDMHRTVPADLPSDLTADYLVDQHRQFRIKAK